MAAAAVAQLSLRHKWAAGIKCKVQIAVWHWKGGADDVSVRLVAQSEQ
jgi:hypothetical protein